MPRKLFKYEICGGTFTWWMITDDDEVIECAFSIKGSVTHYEIQIAPTKM